MRHIVEREIGGRTLSIETGLIAKQASGAVLVKYAGTAVFGAVTAGPPPAHLDFFPMTVDYREKAYAAGKVPGGFFKREGRPTTKEILTARLVDRPIRPLFPDGFRMDLSINLMAVSADKENDPDMLALVAASAALALSEVPCMGPVGGVRIGGKVESHTQLVDGFEINPTHEQRDEGSFDLVIAGTKDAVTMVEAGADEVDERVLLDAIEEGHRVIRTVCEMIDELVSLAGKPKLVFEPPEPNEELDRKVHDMSYDKVMQAIQTRGKMNRKVAEGAVRDEVLETLCPDTDDEAALAAQPDPKEVKSAFETVKKKAERQLIVGRKIRSDGRQGHDIRDINTDFGLLPAVHGCALFTRGETQALVTVTLGTGRDDQIIDGLQDEQREAFMLHYNFPAYCVGETWPNRGPKRREIGHGNLAQRALRPVLPPSDDFPYTIRIVSEITESNGSSSMASVCGGTLAMMDAGIRIKQPVAGIAMGLIREGDEFVVLSDILGSEDHNGDMDFKVAGTQRGVTALQMDIKIDGVDRGIMEQALTQAKDGRVHILREMLSDLNRPREEMHPSAPKVFRIRINPEKIGIVIGPGGKMIKGIQEETRTTIEIEDDGTVTIWGQDQAGAGAARQKIEMLTEDVQEGRTYDGKVVSVKDFGCFVEVMPGQEGLLHISELSDGFVENVSEHVSRGDEIRVKVIGIDPQGRIRLSHKAVLIDEGAAVADGGGDAPRERSESRGEGREGGGGRPRGGGGGGGGRGGPRRGGPNGGGGGRSGGGGNRGGGGPRRRD